MLSNFSKDLAFGQRGEKIVLDSFKALDDKHDFKWVGDNPAFYYKGDIIATDLATGKQSYIEVKNDSCIGQTFNVVCEDKVYYKEGGYWGKGNMYCESDVFCVVSESRRKIYVLDFKVLQHHYRKQRYKEFNYPQQMSITYLFNLYDIEKVNGVIAVVDF